MMLRRLALGIAAALAATSLSAAKVDIPYEEFKLDNGLRVIVHEDHKAPIVAVNLWYHVGSKNERPGRTGFAHLFEHLMFQGSENYKDEFFKPFEDAGATDQNGTTDFDRTNYFQNVPTTALDMALWMESDRMGHFLGAIDQKVLDEQRGVVQNEKRQGDNSPYGKSYYSILEGLFPEGHPYRWSPIGSMDDLNAASIDDVKTWFKTWYGPSNTVLVLAGDIDVKTAKEKVEKYFGDIEPGAPQARRKAFVPKLDAPARDVMEDRVAQARVLRAWTAAPAGTPESDQLTLASRILGGSKTSRLYQRLVLKDQIASSAGSYYSGMEIAGMFAVQADAKPGVDPARLETAIDEEIARFLKDGPTADEVKRARVAIEASFVRGAERIGGFGGKADILAECATFVGKPDCFEDSLAVIAAATPVSIQKAAGEVLSPQHYTLTVLPSPDFKASTAKVDRSSGVPKTETFPDLKFPALQRGKLDNGIEVVLAERHEVPLVQLRMLFDAGHAADQGGKLGTASFALNMLDEGTRTRDAVAIATRMEELGAQIGTNSTLDTSGLWLSALKDELQPSLELFADVVRNPRFDENEIKRVQGQWLASIAQEKTNPSSLASRILPPLLYGEGHAYAVPGTGSGTEASISALTSADLKSFHQNWIRPDSARITVVGDTTLAEIVPALNKVFANWKAPATPRLSKNISDVALPGSATVYLMDKPNAEQTTIFAGHLLPSTQAADRFVTNTAINLLGGQFTARLNLNLREEKHWAYGAYTGQGESLGQRNLFAWAPVQTDKTVESIQEVAREFNEYVGKRPATQAELDRLIANDVRSLPGQYETSAAAAGSLNSIVIFGHPDDYVQTMKARIEGQTLTQVQAAAKAHIHPEALTWVIVGDLGKIEAGVRALNLGPVKILDADGKIIR
jgi:zinc protease